MAPKPRKRKRKPQRKRKPRTHPPLVLDAIARELVARLESIDLDIEDHVATEEPVGFELWHHYFLTFAESYDLGSAASIVLALRATLRAHYRRKTIILLKVGVEHVNQIVAEDWRSVSVTLKFDHAFTGIDNNINYWLRRGTNTYTEVLGIGFKLQTPQWYERANR